MTEGAVSGTGPPGYDVDRRANPAHPADFRTFDVQRDADDTIFDNDERSSTGSSTSIGILTYRRPDEVKRCLEAVLAAIDSQPAGSWSVAEVLVVDNDPDGTARPVVSEAHDRSIGAVSVRYVHEPIPGVATARNRAMAEASGDVLVFIDDDEVPGDQWPQGLLAVLEETGAAMVGGPVLTEFSSPPPGWIIAGDFFRREDPEHKSPQEWLRSGNLAVDLRQVRQAGVGFDPRYRQGEDSAFTRVARAAGLDLRWSTCGAVTEFVGADRFSSRWRMRRDYLSNRAWTRASLDLAGGRTRRVIVRARAVAVAIVRAVQGIGQLATGVAVGRRERSVHGLAAVAGAAGRIVETVTYRRS